LTFSVLTKRFQATVIVATEIDGALGASAGDQMLMNKSLVADLQLAKVAKVAAG
jgi:hypothetical protein